MADVVAYEKRGKIAVITINRPEAMNALTMEVRRRLADAWLQVRDDPEVWTAIVTGAGEKAFCAGADLKEVSARRAAADKGAAVAKRVEMPSEVRGMEVWKPFIAAINGYCLGGGLELAMACDIRVAAEHASFGLPEVKRAIMPGSGTQRFPRLLPFGIALELLLTGDFLNAADALRLGLVNHVVPLPELMSTAEAIANKINGNGPLAVRAVKEAVYRGIDLPVDQGVRLAHVLLQQVLASDDAREGPAAFAQKRKPLYKGR